MRSIEKTVQKQCNNVYEVKGEGVQIANYQNHSIEDCYAAKRIRYLQGP